MKDGIIWIGVVVAVLGAALLGGYFMLRGAGNAAAPVGAAAGSTTTASQASPAPVAPSSSQPESLSTTVPTGSPDQGQTSMASDSGSGAATSTASTAGAATTPVPAGPAGLVAIEKLIKGASDYDGRTVTIKGEILAQCSAGCEFSVDDGTGVLSVQLEGEALDKVLNKGSVGKKVEVTGVFHATPRPQVGVEKLGSWRLY